MPGVLLITPMHDIFSPDLQELCIDEPPGSVRSEFADLAC